jgi:hypothetical protein
LMINFCLLSEVIFIAKIYYSVLFPTCLNYVEISDRLSIKMFVSGSLRTVRSYKGSGVLQTWVHILV